MFISVFLATAPKAEAQQQYPIQIQPSVLFPTAFVSDFANPANTSIRIYLADLTKVNYTINVRVNLTTLAGTVAYKTKVGINITLDGGQVYFLNANELSQLFAISNLQITSTLINSFDNSLSEGTYALSVEAFDANLPTVPVSNVRTDFTLFTVVRYDPPMLTTPANATLFDLQTSNQNIFFNWTPRQVALSPQQQIKYRFRLIKVIPVDRNPYDAMNTTLAGATGNLDVSALDFAAFIYNPTDLDLEAGHVYAWQVQAYEVINGVESTSRFKNQGFSEVFTISIKETCDQITLVTPIVTENEVTFRWNGTSNSVYNEYEFNYRPSNSSAPWIPISTTQNSLTLNNTLIQAGIDYDYSIRVRCTNWLLPVQGPSFKLIAPTCVAPAPVLVNTTGPSTNLSWTAALAADSLRLQYNITGSSLPLTEVFLTANATQYTLPLLTQGGYTIQLDAMCGTDIGAGVQNTFDYNENGIVGPCTIPMPFNLIATRVNGDTAKLVWNNNTTIHTAYSITYWHKDSVGVTRTINPLLIPQTNAIRIYDDQVYAYQIDYVCGNKHVLTPVGMFKISSAAAQLLIDPPTANCFPPVDIRAEARDTITARVEWDKVTGAEEYELSYRILNSGAPFVRFNTTATSATLKPLVAAEKYQLLLRVKCSGLYSIYSDTALVDLAHARNRTCDTAAYFKSLQITVSNIQVAWNLDSTCTGYIIKYREASQPIASEYTQAFTNIDTLIHRNLTPPDTLKYTFQNLKAGTSYVFRIQKICGQQNAIFNIPLVASTLPNAQSSGACGSENVCNKVPRDPLTSLEEGDTIYCADYVILVDSVTTSKSNASLGLFTGLGHMAMPMPGLGDFVNMHVSFDSVLINKRPDACMYEGIINIDSMNASFIPTELRVTIAEFMDQVSATIDSAQAILNQVQAGLTAANNALQQGIDYFQGGDGVGNVVTGELGETPVAANIPVGTTSATVSGNTITIAGTSVSVASLPVLLKDNDNPAKVFQVTATGQVTYVGAYNTAFAKDTTLDLTAQIVTYTEFTGATYDFDAREDAYSRSIQIDREYEKIGTSYYVSAKFITPGALDKVTATLSGAGADASKVVFSNGKGFVYPSTPNGNTFTLNLAGGPGSDGQYIYAWYVNGTSKKAIGKLLLPSYTPQTKKVVIVPVKGKQIFNPATYEAYLNTTYQKIGITYVVTLDNSFRTNKDWTTSSDTSIQSSASGLLSNDYQGKEADVIDAYIAFKGGVANLDVDAAYFMAVYETTLIKDGTSILYGKMPAGEQFGFLYSGGFPASGSTQDANLIRTMAHELGHGAYHMEHTFNTMYLGPTSKFGTNLMDYGADNNLWKFQWDAVHAPGQVWGIFNRDRDAQAVAAAVTDPNFSMEACSTAVVNNGIYYKTSGSKIYSKYVIPPATTINEIKIKFVINPSSDPKTPIKKEFTIVGNVMTENPFDVIPEGKWTVQCYKDGVLASTIVFYIREKKYDYACTVCGRDLTVTLSNLNTMAWGADHIFDQTDADLLTTTLKKAGFTNCKSHAHFFSQSAHETKGFTAFVETSSFSIGVFYNGGTFVGNCNTKLLYSQSFWDNKTYKLYFASSSLTNPFFEVSTNVASKAKFVGNLSTFTWKSKYQKTSDFSSCESTDANAVATDIIKLPGSITAASIIPANTVFYEKYTLTNAQKETCRENLYSLLYATYLGNGDQASGDGYKYRGRGMIHLTGLNNYLAVQNKCNTFFSKSFDFKVNYEFLTTNHEYIIYSAVSYYLYRSGLMNAVKTGNCLSVSRLVNGVHTPNGYANEPSNKYTRLKLFLKYKNEIFYDCNITETE